MKQKSIKKVSKEEEKWTCYITGNCRVDTGSNCDSLNKQRIIKNNNDNK